MREIRHAIKLLSNGASFAGIKTGQEQEKTRFFTLFQAAEATFRTPDHTAKL